MTFLPALFLAVSASAAPMSGLHDGGVLFFHGDLEGAVDRWNSAREGAGSREFDAVLSSALTALGKRELAKGRFARARERFDQALSIDSGNRNLRQLALTAELAEQVGGLRTLRPEETDATEEMDRLLTALLLMDRPSAPEVSGAAAAPVAAPDVSSATAGTPAPSSASAAADKQRQQASALYSRGMERYYAGDYDKASSLFYAALRADPGFTKAHRGVSLVAAALRRREADRRYEEGLRAFYAGDLRKAREKFRDALNLNPGLTKARETLARLDAPAAPAGP